MITQIKFRFLGVLLGTLLVLMAAQAHALRYSFENITNNNPSGAAAGESQLYNEFDFNATVQFSADAEPSPAENGINPGETLGMVFSLNDRSYDGLRNALSLGGNPGGLRMGLKVQGFEGGDSEGLVNNPTPVPEPASMLLLGTGLMGLAFIGRRRLKRY